MNWMNVNVPFKEFVKLGRNKPGTLIEVLSNNRRRQFLIGDINTFSCVSDGGKPFDDNAIVTRYKIIISFYS